MLITNILISLIVPPGIFISILVILACWTIYKYKYIYFGIVLCIIALLMYITSIPAFSTRVNNMVVNVYKRYLPPENTEAAVVVLAAGWSKDENGVPFQPSINTIERLYAAVKLSKECPPCKFLIMSGGYDIYTQSNISIASIMRKAAQIMDCNVKIILEEKSRNTDENLKYSVAIVKKLGVKHVVIVTSNLHIKRAMDFAYQYMPNDVKLYAYPSGGYEKWTVNLTPEMFLPSVDALGASCRGIKELIGGVLAKLTS